MDNKITIEFRDGFQGLSVNSNGKTLKVGIDDWRPYEMFHTALASCMYSTFLDVINKKKLDYEKVALTVDSRKKDEIPSSIEKIDIEFKIFGADKEDEKTVKKFIKSQDLAAKYCSMHNTLKDIVNITSKVEFA
ncbi:MAG: OsmC family protein [Spirochaetales bacterium]|nr:OsmC family protein [Spirochaetales bacterium]